MNYILAVLLPPLACVMVGRAFAGLLLAFLWLSMIGWPIASVIAVLIVMDANSRGNNNAEV